MAERERTASGSKRMSWVAKYTGMGSNSKGKDSSLSLPSQPEGKQVTDYPPTSQSVSSLGLFRTRSTTSVSSSPPMSASNVDSRRSSTSSLSLARTQTLPDNTLYRTSSTSSQSVSTPREGSFSKGAFSRMSLSSMMGGLALSLTRSRNDDDRGRTRSQETNGKHRSLSTTSQQSSGDGDNALARTRSASPFRWRRRSRARETSPSVEALSQSDVESDGESISNRRGIRPRGSAFAASDDDFSGDEAEGSSSSSESWSESENLDSITEQNTELNSQVPPVTAETDGIDGPDPLGEGVNIVVPPEPYFPSTLNSGSRNPKKRKSTRTHVTLPVDTSRPVFQRDRCTITLTQGDPANALEVAGRRPRRYVVASDLSEESRYAIEWGVGTVLRDGDEMIIISVNENETKVDPPVPGTQDRVLKLRCQQERQTLAYILVRQVIGLLQRTKLNVTVVCQAWHAKNSRHMLLDIVDHFEPSMLIVGSRGRGQLKGILLGSTSHYLVQKCSVPVMVARRRLRKPVRRAAHLSSHRARVSLAEAAGVERVTPRVDSEVEHMRDELQRDEERREDMVEEEGDTEVEGENSLGERVKVNREYHEDVVVPA